MRIFPTLILIIYSLVVSAQCGNRYNGVIFSNVNTSTYEYGENTTYTGAFQKLNLDVYAPVGDTVKRRPCVVFCFGGAFVQGARTSPEIVYFANSLAQRGFVCASIDYRLDDTANMRTNTENGAVIRAVQDAKAAIRYLKSRHADLGIDTNMIFIGGTSAGGVTALTMGYTQFEELKDTLKSMVNNLGGWEGNTNTLPHSAKVVGLFNFSGAVLDTTHISSNDLPVYLNHANQDGVVPFRSGFPLNGQSKVLMHGSFNIAQRMKEKGNYYVLDSFSSTNHPAFADPNILTGLGLLNTTSESLRKFLYKVMKCDQSSAQIQNENSSHFVMENPVKGKIRLVEGVLAKDVEIYNLLGHKLDVKFDGLNQLDVSFLPSGIYFMKYKGKVCKLVFE